MRLCLAVLILGIASSFELAPSNAQAAVEFSAGIDIHATAEFEAPLAPVGTWVEVRGHGRCWRPARVAVDWQPYCEGHWEWTDVGWYWVSDEPWAWACYHYGSWVHESGFGWVWVPGVEWAPAWVVWRTSPDYIGWAPYGPRGVVVAPSFFVFVGVQGFHQPIRRNTVIVNNTTIINRTTVVNNIRRENRNFNGVERRVVVNQGPGVDPVQRVTGTAPTPRPIREVVSQTPVPETVKRDQSDRIERPKAASGTAPTSRDGQTTPLPPTGRDSRRDNAEPAKTTTETQPTTAPTQPTTTPTQPTTTPTQPTTTPTQPTTTPTQPRGNVEPSKTKPVNPPTTPPVDDRKPQRENQPPGQVEKPRGNEAVAPTKPETPPDNRGRQGDLSPTGRNPSQGNPEAPKKSNGPPTTPLPPTVAPQRIPPTPVTPPEARHPMQRPNAVPPQHPPHPAQPAPVPPPTPPPDQPKDKDKEHPNDRP